MTKVSQTVSSEKAKAASVKKERIGVVLSDRMKKTVVVESQRQFRHPQYLKVVRSFKKFYVHDEKGEAKKGDLVRIAQTRPYSKLKRWRLVEVVKKADTAKLEVSDVV